MKKLILCFLLAFANAIASPAAVANHEQVTFKNEVYVIGGDSGLANDLRPKAGVYRLNRKTGDWDTLCVDCGWPARSGHRVLVREDSLWLFGGVHRNESGQSTFLNDVWKSADGKTWTKVGVASWSGRSKFAAVVFGNRFWISGGYFGVINVNSDVYSSSDGLVWRAEASLPVGLMRHSMAVLGGQLTVIGGSQSLFPTDANGSIFQSPDGKSWTEAAQVPWSFQSRPLVLHQGGAFALVRYGSFAPEDSLLFSSDGRHWNWFKNDTIFRNYTWSSVSGYGASIVGDTMYLTGGLGTYFVADYLSAEYVGADTPFRVPVNIPVSKVMYLHQGRLKIPSDLRDAQLSLFDLKGFKIISYENLNSERGIEFDLPLGVWFLHFHKMGAVDDWRVLLVR